MDDLFDSNDMAMEDQEAFDIEEEDEEISQEDSWIVIGKYFEEKKLVRQQIDSFNEFVSNTIQELVDDSGEIMITPENQFIPGREAEAYTYVVKFEQIFVGSCTVFEVNEPARELYPLEARLRSMTYCAPMYVNVLTKQFQLGDDGKLDPEAEPIGKQIYLLCYYVYLEYLLHVAP